MKSQNMERADPEKRNLLRQKEVAAVLGVSTKTLGRWRELKEGPPWTTLGGSVYYPRAAFDEYQRAIGATQA